jgi:hypothetical protein
VRGSIPRAELRAIVAATYHQVWWPRHDHPVYGPTTGRALPVWDSTAKAFTDPTTGAPLPTWAQACAELDEPAHVVRFGDQVHSKGVLGGTEEAGRHIGYLTKYLTKSITDAAGYGQQASERQREHARRLHAELRMTPCSPRCAVWLLYGVQPHGARSTMVPGRCKAKAHRYDTLGIAGRRVLVSRKWSGKTLADHRADRRAFVRQLLTEAGITSSTDHQGDGYQWQPLRPGSADMPPRTVLLLHAVAERIRWRAEYQAAQLAASGDPPNHSATADQAA